MEWMGGSEHSQTLATAPEIGGSFFDLGPARASDWESVREFGSRFVGRGSFVIRLKVKAA